MWWVFAPAAAETIYRCGHTLPLYTDRPGDACTRVVMTTRALPARSRASGLAPAESDSLAARRSAVAPLIERAARLHRVEAALLYALVEAESMFVAHAVSSKGARGLAQVMPATAQRYGSFDLMVPEQNLEAGARYLHDLLALFGGDTRLALAAYNAGENAVLRHDRRVPPYPETQAYVSKVLERLNVYRRRQTCAAQEGRC